jgi:hypothetical protein
LRAAVFSAELDELLDAFEKFKRSAAVVDFDDLLYITRRAHSRALFEFDLQLDSGQTALK